MEQIEFRLPDAVANLAVAGHWSVTIALPFIAQGGHMENDLPIMMWLS